MRRIAIISFLLSAIALLGVAAHFRGIVNNAPALWQAADPIREQQLTYIREVQDREILRYAADTYLRGQSLATHHMSRLYALLYATLLALALALFGVGFLALRASNNSFKPKPLRGSA
jgi:hypothetical protein